MRVKKALGIEEAPGELCAVFSGLLVISSASFLPFVTGYKVTVV